MRTLTYFISDLHLGAGYIADHHAQERLLVAFLRSIAPTARRLFLLGDILDYWWEYRDVVPRGFTRFFGALAELADAGVEIIWFKGNHDIWIFDYLPGEIGLKVHDGIMTTTLEGGARFMLEHGDGVGRRPRAFRFLRSMFRSRPLQILFAAIHPHWTIGFAHAWSAHSRKTGGYVPSENAAAGLTEFAEEYNATASEKIDYFIFGHLHLMLDRPLKHGGRLVVLGDWIKNFSYAVWDGSELRLSRFSATKEGNS